MPGESTCRNRLHATDMNHYLAAGAGFLAGSDAAAPEVLSENRRTLDALPRSSEANYLVVELSLTRKW